MILLLDTTVLIDALRARKNRRPFLATLVETGHTLATTAINVGEIYAGMRAHEEASTEVLLASLDCHPITAAIARKLDRSKAVGRKKERHLRWWTCWSQPPLWSMD